MSASQAPTSVNHHHNNINNKNNGTFASTLSTPAQSSKNGSPDVASGDGNVTKGDGAVSMAKGHLNASHGGSGGGNNAAQINFGSMHGQGSDTAALSSSPGVAASFHSGPSTKFGSIAASAGSGKPNDGSVSTAAAAAAKGDGSALPSTPVPPRTMDFNKMFQSGGGGGGGGGGGANSAAKSANGSTAPYSDVGSPAASPSVGRGNASTAARSGGNASRPAFDGYNRTPSQSGHPNAHQSHGGPPGSRIASSGAHPSASYNAAQQQQQSRSPHTSAQTPHMQHMSHMNGAPTAQWQGQPQMYYPQHVYQSYPSYPGMPQQMQHMGQQWAQPQQGYEQAQPHSPRHMPATTASQSGNSSTAPSLAATAGLSSPATSQRSVPHTPSSLASPPSHHIGMGMPPSRAASFHPQSGGPAYAAHSPSHSFSGNAMNASARQFEPAPFQKRISSAIKIVDPNTKAAVEFKAPPKKDQSQPGTPTPAPATPNAAEPTSTAATNADAAASAPSAASGTSTESATVQASSGKTSTPAAAHAAPSFTTSGAAAAAAPAAASPVPAPAPTLAPASANAPAPAPAPATSVPAKTLAAASPSAPKLTTSEDFMKAVKAKADAAKRVKEEKAAAEEAERLADAKRVEEAAKAEADEAARKKAEEDRTKASEAAATQAAAKDVVEPAPALAKPSDDVVVHADDESAQSTEQAAIVKGDEAFLQTPSFKGSAADVERMAREASSVPSTPLESSMPRMPPTPRTPGTPGFGANLPAKPVSSLSTNAAAGATGSAAATAAVSNAINNNSAAASNGIKLDSEALERRRKSTTPSQLDIPSAQSRSASADPASSSTASAALDSARFIDDITKVSYPDKINSPRRELNSSAEPGKFRYDRDFLMQFMGVYKEKPSELPPLASIGMDGSQAVPARGTAGRRTSGMGPPAAPGRSGSIGLGLGASGFGAKGGGMGQFSHPARTSEERFAASSARGGAGTFGSSGPMGSFNAGARSQPLSRTGSGSNAIPTREAMGSGMPSGGRTSSRRGKDRRDPGRSGVNPPEKGGPTIPMDQVVPLSNSENRWVGGRGQNLKTDSPEMVTRKVKALLNKLTLERFDSISTQILDWANKSIDEKDGQTLRIVIALIFEKATDEAAWSEMYATLCRKIMEKLDPNIEDESIKTTDNKPVTGGHLFRKYLVNRCQEDFERGWAQRESTAAAAKSKEAEDNAKKAQKEKDEAEAKEAEARGEKPQTEKENVVMSDEYYEAQKAKRRGLGLVRFIGELFKFHMLSEKIMHLCIQRLLNNASTPEEEEIESLCKLLTTIGKLLEEGKGRNLMDKYFSRMDEMMASPAMTARMRFMLQDVVELRQNNWKPRHDNAAPKTIAQIHEDAAKAKAQADFDRVSRMNVGGSMSRGGSRRGQQREQYGPDGFITVGNQPAAPAHQTKVGNLSGFGKGIERSGTNRPLSVGPQSVFARKNQKSDDGSNPPSRTASSQNIFSLLSSNNEGSDPSQVDDAKPSGRPKLNLAKRTKPLPGQEDAKDEGEVAEGEDDVEGEGDDDEEQADEEDDVEEGKGASAPTDMSDEEAKLRIDNDIKELLEIKNVEEGRLALESLPANRRSDFVNKIVETVLNKKEDDVKLVGQVFTSSRGSGLIDDDIVQAGVKDHVEYLDDISIDVPNAYGYMAILLVASGLPKDKIEQLASTIQGEGVKPPKDRLMAKVEEAM